MNIKLKVAAALAGLAMGGCGHAGHMTGGSASAPSPAPAAPADADKKGECWGVNACKGQGACGGVGHECAGQNACKGQGWLSLSRSECAGKNGKFKAS